MAEKKKKPKKKAEPSNLRKDIKRLKTQVKAGTGIANDLLGEIGFLGRVDENPTWEMNDILSRLKNESYIGGQTAEQIALANAFDQEYANSRNISPLMQESLDLARQGLGGLTAEENTAMNESLMRDADRAFQGGLRGVAGYRAGSGLAGNVGNPLAQRLVNDYTQQGYEAAQQTALKNIDVQNQRRGAFYDLSTLVDKNQFDRAQSTLGARAGWEQYRDQDRMGRFNNYINQVNNVQSDNLNRQLVNKNLLSSEISSRLGVQLGIPQFLEGMQAQRDSNSLAEKSIEAAKMQAQHLIAPNVLATPGVPQGTQPTVDSNGFVSIARTDIPVNTRV